MPQTITEKILSRAAGREVAAGASVRARPDFVLAYDPDVDHIIKTVRDELGVRRVSDPSRFGIFIDHMIPAATPAEEELHLRVRSWCKENGVDIFERRGIGHQVAAEVGYAVPGSFIVHFDGHVSGLGAFGALALGIRRNIIEAFAREYVSMTVPATTRVDVEGELSFGVMARDLFHHLTLRLGRAGCRFQVLELGGPALSSVSTDGWQSVCGLAMFTGAVTAIINPDAATIQRMSKMARKPIAAETSDEGANYAARHTISLSAMEPVVVPPPNPGNVRALRDYIGTRVDVGYLGSCASGRIEDLRAAAMVLKGRKIKPGFNLYVVPTSQEIFVKAAAEGLLEELASAGAFISSSTCDYCFGRIATMSAGQRAVSTGTLNVKGRMGSPDSEIYLCNAAAVAAAAIEGAIVDPRDYLPRGADANR